MSIRAAPIEMSLSSGGSTPSADIIKINAGNVRIDMAYFCSLSQQETTTASGPRLERTPRVPYSQVHRQQPISTVYTRKLTPMQCDRLRFVLTITLFGSVHTATRAADPGAGRRRQEICDHPRRRRRHVAFREPGDGRGDGERDRLVVQHHDPVPVGEGVRRVREGTSRERLRRSSDAQLGVVGLSLGAGRQPGSGSQPARSRTATSTATWRAWPSTPRPRRSRSS